MLQLESISKSHHWWKQEFSQRLVLLGITFYSMTIYSMFCQF